MLPCLKPPRARSTFGTAGTGCWKQEYRKARSDIPAHPLPEVMKPLVCQCPDGAQHFDGVGNDVGRARAYNLIHYFHDRVLLGLHSGAETCTLHLVKNDDVEKCVNIVQDLACTCAAQTRLMGRLAPVLKRETPTTAPSVGAVSLDTSACMKSGPQLSLSSVTRKCNKTFFGWKLSPFRCGTAPGKPRQRSNLIR